jgi:hypothetical protein
MLAPLQLQGKELICSSHVFDFILQKLLHLVNPCLLVRVALKQSISYHVNQAILLVDFVPDLVAQRMNFDQIRTNPQQFFLEIVLKRF